MTSSISYEYYQNQFATNRSGITADGGFFQTFINATGAPSIKGTIVVVGGLIADSVTVAPADSLVPIGAILESGIPNGSPVKVVTYGRGQVLLENLHPATVGYWCGVSGTANGRMSQLPSPPSGTAHSREVGHSLQTALPGIDVLAYVQLHFN